jgi:hypothetical protein
MKFLIGQEEPCTSLNTVHIREEGEQESEVFNVGDTSAINTISIIKHFISYSYLITQIYVAMNPSFHY